MVLSSILAAALGGSAAAGAAGAGTAATAATVAATTGATTAATAGATTAATAGAATAAGAGAGTAAGTAGGLTAAGVAKGALIGAVGGAEMNAGITAIQGGSAGDILSAAGKGAATGAATGAFSAGLGSAVGNAMKTAGGKFMNAVKTAGGKAVEGGKTTGAAAGLETAGQGYMGKLPELNAGTTTPAAPTGAQPQTLSGKLNIKAPGASFQNQLKAGPNGSSGPTPGASFQNQLKAGSNGAIPGNNIHYTIPNKPVGGVQSSTGGSLLNTAKSTAGKFVKDNGLQIGLSIASAGMAAKQANAANAVAQQSLDFQRKTNAEAQAEKDKYKADRYSDAVKSRAAHLDFGKTMSESDSNNTLLTSYSDAGYSSSFSLLTTSITRKKEESIT